MEKIQEIKIFKIKEKDQTFLLFLFCQIFSQTLFFLGVVQIGIFVFVLGFFVLVADFLIFFQKKEFVDRGEASLKNVLWAVQAFIKLNQLLVFLSVFSWIAFSTAVIYGLFISFFVVFFWALFYGIFYILEKKGIPILRIVVIGFFLASWIYFIFQPNPFNILVPLFFFVVFCSFNNSKQKEDIQSVIDQLNSPQKIVDAHYTFDLFLFKNLKTQAIVSTVVLVKVQYVWGLDLGHMLGEYNTFSKEVFSAFKFIIYVSLVVVSLIDIYIITGFNTPTPMDPAGKLALGASVGTFIAAAVGVTNEVIKARAEAQDALTDKALSTTKDPGKEPRVRDEQLKKNRFTSESKEGNLVGTTVQQVAGHEPFLIDKTTNVDVPKNLNYLTTGLDSKEKADAASLRLKIPCKSLEQGRLEAEALNKKSIEVLIKDFDRTRGGSNLYYKPSFKGSAPSVDKNTQDFLSFLKGVDDPKYKFYNKFPIELGNLPKEEVSEDSLKSIGKKKG